MSILCGTDFSEQSDAILSAAAKLAARMQMTLHLVHALDFDRDQMHLERARDAVRNAEAALEQRAQRLRELGARVTGHVKGGPPDEALLEFAPEVGATLILVGALGRRAPQRGQLGSHADRLAQRSHIPVVVLRNPKPFEAWVSERKPLRILLGADFSRSSDEAMSFIEQLRNFGPCDVTALHLYWPPHELSRLGLSGTQDYLDPMPAITEALSRQLTARLEASFGPTQFETQVKPHLGRPGDRIAAIAADAQIDLIVLGSHARSALGRLWEGSVAGATLQCARTSVACVPLGVRRENRAPRIRSVLVATDRSPIGNAAVPLAYSLVEPGGTVHLVQVVHNLDASPHHDIFRLDSALELNEERRRLYSELRDLIPENDTDQITRIHLLESNDVAQAISQAAERLDVSLICLGTHGRPALARAVLGSVAQRVLAHSTRPVLLAHRPRE